MSSQQDPAGDREVFRSTGSLILWWLWAVFAAVALVDLIVQGSGHSAVVMAVLVVAITAHGVRVRVPPAHRRRRRGDHG